MFTSSKHLLLENLEPSNIWEAIKHARWHNASDIEFEYLIRNGTWSLVPIKMVRTSFVASGYFESKERVMAP